MPTSAALDRIEFPLVHCQNIPPDLRETQSCESHGFGRRFIFSGDSWINSESSALARPSASCSSEGNYLLSSTFFSPFHSFLAKVRRHFFESIPKRGTRHDFLLLHDIRKDFVGMFSTCFF